MISKIQIIDEGIAKSNNKNLRAENPNTRLEFRSLKRIILTSPH